MHYSLQRLASLLISCALFISCSTVNSANAKGAHAPSADTVNKEMKMTIKQILDDSKSLEGREVSVQGLSLGWSGKCETSAMLTRSDWILEDETGCIYVTGLLPTGTPNQPKGERIVVQGKVIFGSTGKPIIKADKLTPMPVEAVPPQAK